MKTMRDVLNDVLLENNKPLLGEQGKGKNNASLRVVAVL